MLSVFELPLHFVCEVVLDLINRKILCKSFSFWVVFAIIVIGGYKPISGAPVVEQKSSSPVVALAEKFNADSTVTLACKEIISGEFAHAREILNNAGQVSDPRLLQLGEVVEKYHVLDARRNKSKKDAYDEQIVELEKIGEKGVPEEPNKLSEAFLVVVRASELSDKKQKEELLKRPFVLRDSMVRGLISLVSTPPAVIIASEKGR